MSGERITLVVKCDLTNALAAAEDRHELTRACDFADSVDETVTLVPVAMLRRVLGLKEASITGVWVQAVENHERYSDTGGLEGDIRFLTLGLAGEAGELANFVKKRWRDGDGHDEAIKLEIADVCAYAFMLAARMGQAPADLIATIAHKQAVFIAKRAARQSLTPGEQTP